MARKRRPPTGAGHRRPSPARTPEPPPPPATPIAGPQAFRDLADPAHVQSQAATLLLIGSHLRGDSAAMDARAHAAPAFAGRGGVTVDVLPADDLAALGFPPLSAGTPRFARPALERATGARFAARPGATPTTRDAGTAAARLPAVADAFYRDANPETAAALLEVSLRHPRELVRVAAAASYSDVAIDPAPALRILERAVRSRDGLARDVAAHALARVDPRNAALARLLRPRRRPSRRRRSRTSTIVHGTWARTSAWWQPPGGDFWNYLHDNVDPQLYGAPDRFEWSGGYSDAARALGGSDLHAWVQAHQLNGLDLFTHSHGGSVAMLATHAGIRVGRLVLLSCPVHWPKYTPDFMRVTRIISVRVRLDLVILVDGGGQRFRDGRVEEHVLPIWFDHFATHDPHVWDSEQIAAWL